MHYGRNKYIISCGVFLASLFSFRFTTIYSDDAKKKNSNDFVSNISIVMPAKKICQIVGDYDRKLGGPTLNRTFTRYKLKKTDLGVPFRFDNRTYLLFGDTPGGDVGNGDAIAWTRDSILNDDLKLNFLHDSSGLWSPINIPGISQGPLEVPLDGVEVNNTMYLYFTTGHTEHKAMGRSVVARSDDSGYHFSYLYTLSDQYFINVSIVKISHSNLNSLTSAWSLLPYDTWSLLPDNKGKSESLLVFGSGRFRKSDVYLAFQPTSGIESAESVRYFSGIDNKGNPLWSARETSSVPLFHQPCIGELSVSYNRFIGRWIMLYNCASGPRGLNVINIRTAVQPWGPWSKPQVLFNPKKDSGWGNYIHVSWQVQKCDSVQDSGRQNVWGDVYGPYQYAHFAKGGVGHTTIYFNMSTWNPYTVVLMKAKLAVQKE